MSNRLAISATLSVLMMAIYVLFGTEPVSVPFSNARLLSHANIAAPEVSLEASDLLPLPR